GTLNVHVFAQDESFADALIERLRQQLERHGLKVSEPPFDMDRLIGVSAPPLKRAVDCMVAQEMAQGVSSVHIWKPPAPTLDAFDEFHRCQLLAELWRLERKGKEWTCLNVLCRPRPRRGHRKAIAE